MKVEYDKRRDVVYFSFSTGGAARQVRLDAARIIDYGADGAVLGVEFRHAASSCRACHGPPRSNTRRGDSASSSGCQRWRHRRHAADANRGPWLQLLTDRARRDRSNEGTLDHAFESGLIAGTARRAKVLSD